MSRRLGRWAFGVLLVLLIAGVVVAFAWRRLGVLPYKAPGVRLTYDVSPKLADGAAGVIRQRLAGYEHADVRVEDSSKLVITVWPTDADTELQSESYRVQELIRPIGKLEFFRVIPPDSPEGAVMTQRESIERQAGDTCHWSRVQDRDEASFKYGAITRSQYGSPYVLLDDRPDFCMTQGGMTAPWSIIDAKPVTNPDRSLSVNFKLDAEGTRQFGQLTSACLGQRVAMVVDDVVFSAPHVNASISGGECVITTGPDGFTPPEQTRLVHLFSAGTLPVPLGMPVDEAKGAFAVPAQTGPMLIAIGGLVALLSGLLASGYVAFIRRPKPTIEVLMG